MEIKVTVSGEEEIRRTLAQIDEKMVRSIIEEATHDLFENVKKHAKKHTRSGNMEDNITFRVRKNQGMVYIEDNGMMVEHKGKKINYATFVLFGTRPHKIVPKEKKLLRFTSIKGWVSKHVVKHPGYKGDNFLKTARDATFAKLDKIIDKVVNDELT